MQSFKILPLVDLPQYIEIILCENRDEIEEIDLTGAFSPEDDARFILNTQRDEELDLIGTIIILDSGAERNRGLIMNSAARAGIAFGRLMIGLTNSQGEDAENILEETAAEVTEEIYTRAYDCIFGD